MRLARIRANIRRRVSYRVTRGGVLFALAVMLTGVGAFLSGNNLLFLVFAAMLACLLVSGFLSRLVLAGLELELLVATHVFARTPSPARVRLTNLKKLTPSFSIELAGQPDPVNKTPSILMGALYFPLVPGGATIEAAIEVRFPLRGRHRENLLVISTKFPFGFLRKTANVTLRRETIVYPALEADDATENLLDDMIGEMETHLRGSGRDFYRIRPYEPPDSARHVDWKSTAHTGELHVREYAREQQRVVEIYLDRRIEPGQQQWFERAVESCAYIAWYLSHAEADIWFRSQRFSMFLPDQGEIYDILRFLALVEPVIAFAGDRSAEPPVDASSLQIVFSARIEDFTESGWDVARAFHPDGDQHELRATD